jgi:pyruvate dehydrogenase E2 component (dihydrolipoamide acetyltransferase)
MRIVMPKLGLTMTEGTLSRWLKAEGDEVLPGDILFEFESEKSLLEFECPAEGVLKEIIVAEGLTVPCGAPVAELAVAAERQRAPIRPQSESARSGPVPVINPDSVSPAPSSGLATPAAKRRARELGVALSGLAGRGPHGRIHVADVESAVTAPPPDIAGSKTVTPVAERLASDLGVDWARLEGSGYSGRVLKDDVLHATSDQPDHGDMPAPTKSPIPPLSKPLDGVRRVIARRMSESAFTAPHVTLMTEADATALVEARNQLNAELRDVTKISFNTLLLAVVSRLLVENPDLNACLAGEEIRYYQDINIALAVDTERGLLVPVVRQVDRLDLITIQQVSDALIERALAGKSLPDDLEGGTFTISNLGMFDIDGFTPIINQPQAAILGVGRIVAKPVVGPDNEIVVRQRLTLSLSFDHRLVDGGPAARFLQRVKQLVERPFTLVIPPGRL